MLPVPKAMHKESIEGEDSGTNPTMCPDSSATTMRVPGSVMAARNAASE